MYPTPWEVVGQPVFSLFHVLLLVGSNAATLLVSTLRAHGALIPSTAA
jgi:hypothetical protein